MQIGNLTDVRAIARSPITGNLELIHPDDVDGLAESYNGVTVFGVVGLRESVCNTLRGPVTHTVPDMLTVHDGRLPEDIRVRLLNEYAGLVA